MTATAIWLRAWLSGSAGSDDLLEVLARVAPDTPPLVVPAGSRPRPLPDLLRALRASSAPRVWLLLPRPGHPGAWPREVLDPPQAAVLVGAGHRAGAPRSEGIGPTGTAPPVQESGLVRAAAAGWRWDPAPEARVLLEGQALTARAGARALAEAVTDAAARLEPLGLDRAATQQAPRVWQQAMGHLPLGLHPAQQSLLVRLAELHDALDLALLDMGGAVTAAEARARSGEVRAVIGAVEDIICGVIGGMNVISGTTP